PSATTATRSPVEASYRRTGRPGRTISISTIGGWCECRSAGPGHGHGVETRSEGDIVATSTVEAEVQALINDWANALRHKDAAGVVSLQTDDFVHFSLGPPLRADGPDRDGLEDWFSSWEGPIDYEIRDQTITAAEDVAFSHSLNRMRATTTDGEP